MNKITVEIEISEAKARQVLTTAYEAGTVHGIGYWAWVQTAEYTPCEGVMDDQIEKMIIAPAEADDTTFMRQTIDAATIREGFRTLLSHRVANSDLTGRALFYLHAKPEDEEMDGPLADAIIQAGMFGEMSYG